MKYRVLGKTGLRVSEIGFGGWAIGGNRFGNSYGQTQDEVSLAALETAHEMGCNFFDTADVYGHGHGEELIGQALKNWLRDEVIIATKAGGDFYKTGETRPNFSEAHLRFALEQSLKRLGTDYIDVYQLHNPTLALIHHGLMFEAMRKFQQEGKIRFYGISIFDPQEGIQAIQRGGVDTVQAVYNLFDRRPERGLFAACENAETGFIAREPLANGFLTGKFDAAVKFEQGDIRANWPPPLLARRVSSAEEYRKAMPSYYPSLSALALKFALSQPAVSVVIPGCKTPEQARQNFSASDLPNLTAEELHAVAEVQGTFA